MILYGIYVPRGGILNLVWNDDLGSSLPMLPKRVGIRTFDCGRGMTHCDATVDVALVNLVVAVMPPVVAIFSNGVRIGPSLVSGITFCGVLGAFISVGGRVIFGNALPLLNAYIDKSK